jgi:hypothetical protein
VKNRSLLGETEGSIAGPTGTSDGALMSLPLKDVWDILLQAAQDMALRLCPTTFGSAREEPMVGKWASVCRGFFTLVKSEALT